jgi:hypothetical protein
LVSGKVTVFVGTACGSSPACDSLFRYDFATDGTTIPPVSGSWPNDCEVKAFIRDIVLDENASGGPRAYVAAYSRGIRAFDIANEDMVEITTDGWPIIDPSGTSDGTLRYVCLDYYAPDNLLVAGMGGGPGAEVQEWGTCALVESCDDDFVGPESAIGLVVYRLDDSPVNLADGSLGFGSLSTDLPKPPLDLAVRPRDGTETQFLIDVSCFAHPLAVVKAQRYGDRWNLIRVGNWDEDNDPADGPPAPGGGFDDVMRIGNVLYVTTEGTLLTFNLSSSPATALGNYAGFQKQGSVLLNRMSDTIAADPGVLYSNNFSSGIRFYDVTHPLGPVPSAGFMPVGGRGYTCYAVEGLGSDSGHRWLYTASMRDDDSNALNC